MLWCIDFALYFVFLFLLLIVYFDSFKKIKVLSNRSVLFKCCLSLSPNNNRSFVVVFDTGTIKTWFFLWEGNTSKEGTEMFLSAADAAGGRQCTFQAWDVWDVSRGEVKAGA